MKPELTFPTGKHLLRESETPMSMSAYVDQMKSLNLSNSIFVDNTASEKVAKYYESILGASISISTPNKVAASASYLQYERIKHLADKRGVLFLYETNVGAGLPVISTLNDLMVSGDRILKIEGVLSGSLSYIFNAFQAGTPFSLAVAQARELGYTEPDPRVDLNGLDVRRKLLILAREAGAAIEMEEIEIHNFLPEVCQQAKTVDAFMETLVETENYFDDLRRTAEASGKALRIVAKLENNKATIGLEAFDTKHPFYMLSGSDNMIVFTTERYKDRPLVVQGPGAGAEVTAAGIFAEIIKIGHFLS